jgi:pantoate--beta-alanine ligase
VSDTRIFLALGSNQDDPRAQFDRALAALDEGPLRLVAAARYVRGPYVGGEADAAPVVNTVVEVRSALEPHALLAHLHELEATAGRVRAGGSARTLDLDLLCHGATVCADETLILPHPRFAERAFVLAPWEEIAPDFEVPASPAAPAGAVVRHAATLRRAAPARFTALAFHADPTFPDRGGACVVLETRPALEAWRAGCTGRVGVVPTMGALHAGHASLVQRAAAECESVIATLFVNPLQFAPGEDLARYPRTFEADCRLLAHHGADAVYAPAPEDLFPPGFATQIVPEGAALGLEGAERPTHFQGVATIVCKLWARTRPDRGYFGRKDAQQLAVLRQVFRDLDVPGTILACPTVRAGDGLARSSRNRYLDDAQRRLAGTLSRVLAHLGVQLAGGEARAEVLETAGRAALEMAGLDVDYLRLVEAETMTPVAHVRGPTLAVAAVRLGPVRLLDNCWVAPPFESVPA